MNWATHSLYQRAGLNSRWTEQAAGRQVVVELIPEAKTCGAGIVISHDAAVPDSLSEVTAFQRSAT
jgi:alpha-D-ribose 1-methylphosphonate 5-triphosphate synthase subunit PhnL